MRYLFVLTLWLLIGSAAFATHLFGGYIQAQAINNSPSTYLITLIIYSPPLYGVAAQTTDKVICFGDNSPAQQLGRVLPVTLSADKSFIISRYNVFHTYSGPGVYTLSVSEINRTLTRNVSDNQPLLLRTTVQVGTQLNQTPVFSLPATGLTFANRQSVAISLAGVDLEGDSLSYALATPLTIGTTNSSSCQPIVTVPTYQFPNDVLRAGTYRLNARTGQLIWNLPTESGMFTAAVTVSEWRAGVLISQTQHEVVLTIVDQGGISVTPPPYEPAQVGLLTALPESDYGELHLTVSPNPVVDFVRVRLTNDQRVPARLLLLDSQGRIRQTVEVAPIPEPRHYQFDVSQYPAGTYLIRAECNGQRVVSKVVKP